MTILTADYSFSERISIDEKFGSLTYLHWDGIATSNLHSETNIPTLLLAVSEGMSIRTPSINS